MYKPSILNLLFFILSISNTAIASPKLEKAFKALQEQNLPEAKDLLTNILLTDSTNAGADFGLSIYYYRLIKNNDIMDANFGPSYEYLMKAYKNFDKVNKKDVDLYNELGITKENFLIQKENLEGMVLVQVRKSNDSDYAFWFLTKYKREPLTKYYKECEDLYETFSYNTFKKLKDASYCKEFIRRFPNSKYLPVVQRTYDSLIFTSYKSYNNIDSLNSFIIKYPNNAFYSDAQIYRDYMIYLDFTKNNTRSEFENYIAKYPNSKVISIANKNLKQLNDLQQNDNPEQDVYIKFESEQLRSNGNIYINKTTYAKKNYDIIKNTNNCVFKTDLNRQEYGNSGSMESFLLNKNNYILYNSNKSFIAIQTRYSSFDNKPYIFFDTYNLENTLFTSSSLDLKKTSTKYYSLEKLLKPFETKCTESGQYCNIFKSAIKLSNNNVALLFELSGLNNKLNKALPTLSGKYGFGEIKQDEYSFLNNFRPVYKLIILNEDCSKIINEKFYIGSITNMYASKDGGLYLVQNISSKQTSIQEIQTNIIYKGISSNGIEMTDEGPISVNRGISLIKLSGNLEKLFVAELVSTDNPNLTPDIFFDLIEVNNNVYILSYTYKYGIINNPTMCIYKLDGKTIERYTRTEDYVFYRDDKYLNGPFIISYSIYKNPQKAKQRFVMLNNELHLEYQNDYPMKIFYPKLILQNQKIDFK